MNINFVQELGDKQKHSHGSSSCNGVLIYIQCGRESNGQSLSRSVHDCIALLLNSFFKLSFSLYSFLFVSLCVC